MSAIVEIPAHVPTVAPTVDVVLRDGSTVSVRRLVPEDEGRLFDFFQALSEDSRSRRFFGTVSDDSLRREARAFAGEGSDLVGLIATVGRDERVIGHAMYAPTQPDRAEAAVAVADECQGLGLGAILLGQLAQHACAAGIRVFTAIFLPENHQMLRVFRESGFPIQIEAAPGEIRVELPTEPTEAARQAFEDREWIAATNAVRAFFHPRSVAVIGASRRRGTIAGEVLHNLLSFGFQGPVLPVNPNAPVVQSVVAYPDVEAVPGPVDLAVVVVPAERVLEVAEGCGRKGVRGLVVISAGFGETGDEGRAMQDELVRICRSHRMRLIGPNCMGILNTDPEVRLNATFAPKAPIAGRVGFMSQSGALGLAVIDYASVLGLGLSTFVSVGNKADISGNDLIRYWEQDDATEAILLYLESFGNPRKFSRIARRVARKKPILVVKSGRSVAGARATGSHTGALLAASDVTVDALFRQAGVIRTDTLSEMFDVASLLANQPVPKGKRVAILTNAGGGPGILCVDTCEAEGLTIATLSDETSAKLRALLPAEASIENPVDMIASASADQYREAIRVIGEDPGVDSIVAIFIPPLVTRPEDAANAIVEGARALHGEKPVLAVFMQSHGVPEELRAPDIHIPSFSFPEDAAIALSRIAKYGEWLGREAAPTARIADVRREEAAGVVAAALGRGADWLEAEELASLLDCYGLAGLDQRFVDGPEAAGRAALELGGSVALKAIAPGLLHKSDAGAVEIGIDPSDVEAAAHAMALRLEAAGAAPTGFHVQRMASPGVEMIVGVVHDPQFGPVIACGAGGVLVELLKDVSVRLTPLSHRDAEEMVTGLKTYPLLTGYRGSPARDVPALVDAILRIGAMVDDLPQIAELDLNPILVHTEGVSIVDARVRVAPAEPAPLLGSR